MTTYTVGVVGNPNCGKTTLFNALTGSRHTVGNWPGVTVERKTGVYAFEGDRFEVVDLPGIYSLSARSLDERIARDYVLSGKPDLILNIVDGANLERNLYLTLQLIQMRVPIVVALNMMDVVRASRIDIRVERLAELLGCPVVPVVARTGEGTGDLRKAVAERAHSRAISTAHVGYPREVEEAIAALIGATAEAAAARRVDARWLAINLLENDPLALSIAGAAATDILARAKRRIEAALGDESDMAIADGRYGFIHGIARSVISRSGQVRRSVTYALDKVALNPYLGIPVFLVMMYVTFTVTITFGGCFIDFFDQLAGVVFVDWFGRLLESVGAPPFLKVLLADGVGGGVRLIAALIPPIGLMFACLAVLEDSGYMARAAFVMDRLMRLIGLPGKAFVPLLVGVGCNVPAIMATRTLDRGRDRLLTVALNPLMSCGARLPVYALFGAAFFPESRGLLVLSLYLVGILLAVGTGLILKGTLLRADVPTFVMELPPYHVPTVRGVVTHAWHRLQAFLFRAGKVIMAVVVLMSVFNSLGTDGRFGHEGTGKSLLAAAGRAIVPALQPMGISERNWPAAVGIFSGIFAKEAVVGTLNSLYTQMDSEGEPQEKGTPFDFWAGVRDALATVPANLRDTFGTGLLATVVDPAGLKTATEAAPDVRSGTYAALRDYFDGRVGAYAYLLFVLIYAPCVAAMAAIYRETGLRWAAFVIGYLTALAWVVATAFYQAATFSRHPAQSLAWVGGLGLALAAYVLVLRVVGRRVARRKADQ